MNNKAIFSAGIARKLIQMGFIVKDIQPNKNNQTYTVFYFENTPEFKKALNKISKRISKGESYEYKHKDISGSNIQEWENIF